MWAASAPRRIYTLVATAKLNDVDPQAGLAAVPARINDHAVQRRGELLLWNWRKPCRAMSRRREVRGHMRANGLSAADKSAVTAACQQLIDDFLKPRFPAHYPADAVQLPRRYPWESGTAPNIASFNATTPASRRISAKSSMPRSPASTGSAAIASTSNGTVTPENRSACIAALPSPKQLTR